MPRISCRFSATPAFAWKIPSAWEMSFSTESAMKRQSPNSSNFPSTGHSARAGDCHTSLRDSRDSHELRTAFSKFAWNPRSARPSRPSLPASETRCNRLRASSRGRSLTEAQNSKRKPLISRPSALVRTIGRRPRSGAFREAATHCVGSSAGLQSSDRRISRIDHTARNIPITVARKRCPVPGEGP